MLMAKCQDFVTGLGMTGTLNIRYMAPTPLNTEIRFESRVTKVEGRKLLTEARVFAGDTQTVSATGVWISSQGNYQLRDAYAHLAEPADNDRETA
jgi:acyl-coenzyme A thioesterase PaaI-like protein